MRGWRFPLFGILIGTIVAWWLYPAASKLVRGSVPTSHWFEVNSVDVASVHIGSIPTVRIDWSIERPFVASWVTTLRRKSADGFKTYCTRSGRSEFRPDTGKPSDTAVGSQISALSGEECPALLPGAYVLTLAWAIEVDGLPPRVLRVESNIFEVKE